MIPIQVDAEDSQKYEGVLQRLAKQDQKHQEQMVSV